MLGIVQLARTTDKAKAVAHHSIAEYRYDCPTHAKSDHEIEAYAKTFVSRKDPRNIEACNKKFLTTRPSGDAWKRFEELRDKIAP